MVWTVDLHFNRRCRKSVPQVRDLCFLGRGNTGAVECYHRVSEERPRNVSLFVYAFDLWITATVVLSVGENIRGRGIGFSGLGGKDLVHSLRNIRRKLLTKRLSRLSKTDSTKSLKRLQQTLPLSQSTRLKRLYKL